MSAICVGSNEVWRYVQVIQVLFGYIAASLVPRDDGNALSIGLSNVIKLMIKENNNDLYTMGALHVTMG